jgi:serine/threonine-protein kinase
VDVVNDGLIGQVLDGRYKIEKVLGEGGMGIVYKAVHTSLGKPLAIKVLRPEVSKNEEIVMRFRQEAQSASQIGNPHIIDISDFGSLADGSTYIAAVKKTS